MNLFTDDGELSSYIYDKMEAIGRLEGEEAIAWLADNFAAKTHGNYCGDTLYHRTGLGKYYKITIEKL